MGGRSIRWLALPLLTLAIDNPRNPLDLRMEVVVAHSENELSWLQRYVSPDVTLTIYSKNDNPPFLASEILPNVGGEAHTYLHHIVNHYEALADWTVFTKDSEPSRGGCKETGNQNTLSDQVEFQDYLKPYPNGQDSYFVFAAVTQFPLAAHLCRIGLINSQYAMASKDPCPPPGNQGWSPWWHSFRHLLVKSNAAKGLQAFYYDLVGLEKDDGKPLVLAYAPGSLFAVSKARIHARPRSYYTKLLRAVSGHPEPLERLWLEVSWFDVFHPEALQSRAPRCKYPPVPANLSTGVLIGKPWRRVMDAFAAGNFSLAGLHGGRVAALPPTVEVVMDAPEGDPMRELAESIAQAMEESGLAGEYEVTISKIDQ